MIQKFLSLSLPIFFTHLKCPIYHLHHEEKLELPQGDGNYINENEFLSPTIYRSPKSAFQSLPEWRKGEAPAIGSRNPPSFSAFAADVREVVHKQRQESSSGLPDYV